MISGAFLREKRECTATTTTTFPPSSASDGFNIAVLLVHHLRKLQDSDDPFNDVSVSTGIIGAADTNFILRRDGDDANDAGIAI